MKKLIGLALLGAVMLTGCAGAGVVDLPQSTRIDREEVARLAQMTLLAAETAVGAQNDEIAVFHTRPDGTIVFNMWTQTDPDHPLSAGLLRFQQEVATRSNGELAVDIRVSAGNDGDSLNRVMNNQLDAAVITVWSAWSGINPLANLESLPFLFTNYDEAWRAYEGSLGQWVTDEIINPSGMVALGYWTNGLRHFTNNVRPIYTPNDLIGLRMRSMQTSTQLETYATFGAASISLPFGQVHGGLAAGDFDGQDNPLGNIYAAQLYEVQRYLSLSGHMYSSAPVIVSTDFWESLSPAHRQILIESSLYAGRYQGERTRAEYQSQIAAMTAAGMMVNEVDIAAFEEAVIPVWTAHMAQFGNDMAIMASRYIADPNALAHRFGDGMGYVAPEVDVEILEDEDEDEELEG